MDWFASSLSWHFAVLRACMGLWALIIITATTLRHNPMAFARVSRIFIHGWALTIIMVSLSGPHRYERAVREQASAESALAQLVRRQNAPCLPSSLHLGMHRSSGRPTECGRSSCGCCCSSSFSCCSCSSCSSSCSSCFFRRLGGRLRWP